MKMRLIVTRIPNGFLQCGCVDGGCPAPYSKRELQARGMECDEGWGVQSWRVSGRMSTRESIMESKELACSRRGPLTDRIDLKQRQRKRRTGQKGTARGNVSSPVRFQSERAAMSSSGAKNLVGPWSIVEVHRRPGENPCRSIP